MRRLTTLSASAVFLLTACCLERMPSAGFAAQQGPAPLTVDITNLVGCPMLDGVTVTLANTGLASGRHWEGKTLLRPDWYVWVGVSYFDTPAGRNWGVSVQFGNADRRTLAVFFASATVIQAVNSSPLRVVFEVFNGPHHIHGSDTSGLTTDLPRRNRIRVTVIE